MSGLHNAIGITYRPPASVLTLNVNSYVQLPQTPPASPGASPYDSAFDSPLSARPMTSPTKRSRGLEDAPPLPEDDAKRPRTPKIEHLNGCANTVVPSPAKYGRQTERTISVLYTPHGVEYKCIEPWAQGHLLEKAALPLTVMLHGFNVVGGPWYTGGVMMAGTS